MAIWKQVGEPESEAADSWETGRGRFAAGTPEDVAALYTWANLQGARYRDFSASRRRYREQVRARAAESRQPAPEQPGAPVEAPPGRSPFSMESTGARPIASSFSFQSTRGDLILPGRLHVEEEPENDLIPATPMHDELLWEPAPVRAAQELPLEDPAQVWASDRWERIDDSNIPEIESHQTPSLASVDAPSRESFIAPPRPSSGAVRAWELGRFPEDTFDDEYAGPAWLYGPESNARPSRAVPAVRKSVGAETLEDARDALGSRWSALKGVFDQGRTEPRSTQLMPPGERRAPLLVVFSLAGGVGKTSLLATLGRALSASGEKVALGDAAAYSLLPFYFGARDLRPGAMRAFAPPEGSDDAPIFLANYDLSRRGEEDQQRRQLIAEILRNGAESNRIMLDLPASAQWLVRRIGTLNPTVLVPLAPDMNSVIGIEAVERYFESVADADGAPLLPFYLLNQFDGSLALHLDVREVLRRRLGERLLSFVIRRSPVVSEALAEGMTVVDYAPDSPVAHDYFDVASWLRTVSPASASMRTPRSATR